MKVLKIRMGGGRWLALLAACAALWAPAAARAHEDVEIRRTTDGLPHLRADGWHGLGTGIGYVQAQDALCTLAEAFVTYEGRRAWFFGPDATPARDSTFGRARNLDLDLFFRAFADDALLARYRAALPPALIELIDGYAAGYNRSLAEQRRRPGGAAQRPCTGAAWVREIGPADVYRRLFAAQVAGGYAHFIAEIVNAAPGRVPADRPVARRAHPVHPVGEQDGVGSNVLAFGREVTGEAGGVLFGNPHWYWGGPDRFYQMHLAIPGRLNVAGVGFLGVPLVMIGFNEQVAWSHTVSAARRFGLFDLVLDPADPTRIVVDGRSEPMQARTVRVAFREGGKTRHATRTFYRTRFGPVLDLSRHDPSLGWGREHAIAIRDVNAENFRVFRNFFLWNQATSLDDFVQIQRREAAVPWVNTAAIGRGDGRVWYADVGAVPNVPDALREACATPRSQGFARVDAQTPFLDGSRAACDWPTDPRAVQPGAMPAAVQPALLREDYVANMNDSHWLSNARQPLEGYPAVFGGERQPLSLRGRLGHQIAAELSRGGPSSAEALDRRLRDAVLTPRAYSAERFKDDLLPQACARPRVQVSARQVDLTAACAVLRRWNGQAEAGARGVLLWEAFWGQLETTLEPAVLYRVPFSSEAPLQTPRAAGPGPGDARVPQALAAAVLALRARGVALDAPLGRYRAVHSGGRTLPFYGGCHATGYFTVACNEDGSDRLGPDTLGNSYLQVVRFGPDGVEAHTLLAHGQDEDALTAGRGLAPVSRYARKDWLRFPFREEDIARDPQLRRSVLRP